VAWCVLEDLIEDARIDSLGRRVATSSVRSLAENLGLSKDTTARALRRLASAQLIEALPARRVDRGRFGGGAYLIRGAAQRGDIATAGGRVVAAPESRRLPARSTAVSQPTLFDAAVDPGESAGGSAPGPAAGGSAPGPAAVGERAEQDAGRGGAVAGARTGEDAGRDEAGGEAEAPGRRAAG
jgi:DNA-binding transcriptional MocR family regulator